METLGIWGKRDGRKAIVFTHHPLKCDPFPGQEGSCSVVMGWLCCVMLRVL